MPPNIREVIANDAKKEWWNHSYFLHDNLDFPVTRL